MAISAYDKTIMSDSDLAKLQEYTNGWEMATNDNDRNAYNLAANKLRAKYNYSMGSDGATYSELPTTVSTNSGVNSSARQNVAQIDTSNYLAGAQAQATQQKTTARENYIKNLTNLASTYNQNRTDVLNTAADTAQQYKNTMSTAYQNAYTNNELAKQNAVANGLQSTGLANAMQTSALAAANQNIGNIASERNTALTQLANQLDSLSATYNTDRDAALQELYNNELKADADAYSNYFTNLLSADTTNASALNQYLLTVLGYDATAIENAKARAQEAANLATQLSSGIEEKKLEIAGNRELQELTGSQQLALIAERAKHGFTS